MESLFETCVQNQKDGHLAPLLGVLDTHFSFFPQEQTNYTTTRSNNDARHCNFTCDCGFTLFMASLPVTFVRASYHFPLLATFLN